MDTLYITDLDGTLLNSDTQLSPFTLSVMNTLVARGLAFTYATARSLESARPVTAGLDLRLPAVTYNGTFIVRPQTGEILDCQTFTSKQAGYVIRAICQTGIWPLVYGLIDGRERVSWVAGNENEGLKHYLSLKKGDRRLRPLKDEEGLYDGEIYYFTCIGEKQELMPLYQRLCDHKDYHCTLQQEIYRPEYWCEIMPRAASKANGILRLKSILGCKRIISFGDAINDLPMCRISDEFYAVANGVDALKTHATAIIPGNDEDGVARWLLENARLEIS